LSRHGCFSDGDVGLGFFGDVFQGLEADGNGKGFPVVVEAFDLIDVRE
jgi:hypothetical protein